MKFHKVASVQMSISLDAQVKTFYNVDKLICPTSSFKKKNVRHDRVTASITKALCQKNTNLCEMITF